MSSFDFTVYKGSPTGEIFEAVSHRPALTNDEIYIQITHSGVCGTDEHFKWVVQGLGHEGVGVVKAIGPDVKTFKVYVSHFHSSSLEVCYFMLMVE